MTAADDIRTLAATKSWGRGRIYDSITETIGHTPLVRLNKLAATSKAKAHVLLSSNSSIRSPRSRIASACP